MAKGVAAVDVLVAKFIKKSEYVHRTTKNIAKLFGPSLVDALVTFNNEEHAKAQGATLVADCTVCQIKRPKQPFDEAKVFRGKHYIYVL